MEQKIKQDEICIGANIRRIRQKQKVGQTELVRRLPGIITARFPIIIAAKAGRCAASPA